MIRKWLCYVLLLSFSVCAAGADEVTSMAVQNDLLQTEHKLAADAVPSNAAQGVLQSSLEEKRRSYARFAELVAEGIASEQQLDKSRAEYERVLILLASRKTPVDKVMLEVQALRGRVNQWRDEQIAARRLEEM